MSLNIFNFSNTIISRYLLRNLAVFFIAIFFIIALIIFGNQFVLTVQESVEHGIPIQELMPIVGFNMLRDLPIILSLALQGKLPYDNAIVHGSVTLSALPIGSELAF